MAAVFPVSCWAGERGSNPIDDLMALDRSNGVRLDGGDDRLGAGGDGAHAQGADETLNLCAHWVRCWWLRFVCMGVRTLDLHPNDGNEIYAVGQWECEGLSFFGSAEQGGLGKGGNHPAVRRRAEVL